MTCPNLPADQKGYHRLATLMTRDESLAIFRKYDFANAISLLSLQAEVQELEAEFLDQCRRDKATDRPFSNSFKTLREDGNGGSEQNQKLQALRKGVGQYMSRLSELHPPAPSQLGALRDWLMDERGGANFLLRSESRLWEVEEGSRFVQIGRSRGERDKFTKFTSWVLISVLHKYFGLWRTAGRPVDAEAGMISYDESKLLKAGTLIATVLSSIIPVLSIYALFVVKNPYARIGIAAGFTALFAGLLAAFSSARRIEIFAATAT
ncbi:hypothetical protein A1O3_00412 [Capronia epimyces CBS 606.96]|uniref:DUF6594 domain-containing protein n=1 Tax=Capronia epimyces CBS 606.96 TaxID=1182542 RepID=W9YG79_9EURO|nr:uncharacterized protein A1O3_00412 [Capronia epimyces CBS 606.96]EXJ91862.1 hypothetical protein A1O3_00412 [Capronia epimyces CBS 606.96]